MTGETFALAILIGPVLVGAIHLARIAATLEDIRDELRKDRQS